nr:hypothetical protein [Sedimentibacter sp.]
MLTEKHKEKIKYLSQYKFLNAETDRKIKELEDWKNKIYSVTGTLTDMPRSNSRRDKISDGIAAINEIEENINGDIEKLLKVRKDVQSKIDTIEDLKLRELMKCRYLDFNTWEEIAYKNGFSWQWVYKLHEKSLDKIKI